MSCRPRQGRQQQTFHDGKVAACSQSSRASQMYKQQAEGSTPTRHADSLAWVPLHLLVLRRAPQAAAAGKGLLQGCSRSCCLHPSSIRGRRAGSSLLAGVKRLQEGCARLCCLRAGLPHSRAPCCSGLAGIKDLCQRIAGSCGLGLTHGPIGHGAADCGCAGVFSLEGALECSASRGCLRPRICGPSICAWGSSFAHLVGGEVDSKQHGILCRPG